MNKQKFKKVTARVLVAVVCLIMIFSVALTSLGTTAAVSAESYSSIRENNSIYSDYTSFLDGSVVQKLPETVKDTDIISVIIKLDTPSIMDAYKQTNRSLSFAEFAKTDEAMAIKAQIAAEKTAYLQSLDEKGISYSTGADYSNILSGFEVLYEACNFEGACDALGEGATAVVGEVYEVADTQLVENDVDIYEDTGIFDSSDFAYDGSGMVIAVLDTGLDYTHPAFSVENFSYSGALGLTKDEVASHISNTNAAELVAGLTVDDVYRSDKVPFSFDYADNDSDVYSLHNNHGTHVSGVIVGKDDTITGVAPGAQLVSMKIFSDTMDSARSSWILAALEDCVELGVDVINMSLGQACGFSRESDKEIISGVYEDIRELGISLVVAASNSFTSTYGSEKNGNYGLTSNPDTGTVGSPSTYDGALSVASIDGTKTPYILDSDGKIIYFVEASDAAGDEKYFFDDLLGSSTDALTLEYVLVPGVGTESDYDGIDVTGKIALVRRGTNTFEEKAAEAQKKGAKAIIVYNNTSGDIKMNVGITSIPVCSISQDDGERLAAAKKGTLTIARDQSSGPFMSDFSSWGPSPSLGIKPEITAHGGNILSAVTGHGYDRLSGTSMACPNMSGVIALMRQYVLGAPEFTDQITNEYGNIDYTEVNAIVNRLLMSTADTIINKNGLPYAVRKQGSGLANLDDAASTKAYILTYDREDGSVMDKSKIELGDDPDKTGVYVLKFSVYNFGSSALSYDLTASVMTEGVSDTLTYKGETVVSEEGYLLNGAKVTITNVSGGTRNGSSVTVNAGETCDITLTITLSDEDKRYLDDSFENGMYVEGFVNLTAKDSDSTDLSVPYLAFYGDWYQAPLFDIDYFETNADELNDAIATLDKTLPDAYATRPIGGISDDYVSYLGSFYFLQDPSNKIISAKREYIAISNAEGTICSLRFVWGGQLRNAEKIVITITDDATGEVIFEKTENSIRKSYGDGGSYIYPTNIEIEFDAAEHNLKNNSTYTVKLQGYLDYGDGGLEENLNNTFEFPLTIDFEAPALTDCEFYTEYDKDAKKTRLYAKLAVYDNHYSMGMQVGYIGKTTIDGEETLALNAFDKYITPIYSSHNGTTYVTYELTDHIYDIVNSKTGSYNKNTFAVTLYDYALNLATYEVDLPDNILDFYLKEINGLEYDETLDSGNGAYALTLNVNEVYQLEADVFPETEWQHFLTIQPNKTGIINVVNDKLAAVGEGKVIVKVTNPYTGKEIKIYVTVVNTKTVTKPVADVFELTGYYTEKAFYLMSSEDRDIGEAGDLNLFVNDSYSIEMYPSEVISIRYKLDAYFPDDCEVVFKSGDESKVTVSSDGTVTAVGKGNTTVSITVKMDGKNTKYSKTLRIEVKDPYVRTGPTLNSYYGAGELNSGEVIIPSDKLFTQIGQYAFSNYEYVPKDLTAGDVINDEEPDATKMVPIGNSGIRRVIIPEGVESIGAYAFALCENLEYVELPSTLETIEYGAFYGCTNLKVVKGLENVKLINKYAFQGCDISNDISFDNIHAIGDYAFEGNKNLGKVTFGENLSTVGSYAFAANHSLEEVDTSKAGNIKYGSFAFLECKSLTSFHADTNVIPSGMFYGCTLLESLTIGRDVSTIGEYALSKTSITTFTVESGNTAYTANADGTCLLDTAGTTLLMVSPSKSGVFELSGVTRIGNGAFSGNTGITEIIMPDVIYVDDYAFTECRNLTKVTLGELEHIGKYAFYLTDITELPSFSSALTEIEAYAFAYTLITSVAIDDGITIGEGAFCECTKLKSVTIGDNVTVGRGAFLRGTTTVDPRYDGSISDAPYLNIGGIAQDIYGTGFWYSEYLSELTSLTIGENADIGYGAFLGAANLESVTLGSGARIGEMAFYNCMKLRTIDLSGVKSIGNMAFTGDNRYMFTDKSMSNYAVKDNMYVIYYYSPVLRSIDLSSLEADGLGDQAFIFCKQLESVTLGTELKTIPYMAFSNCDNLKTINLENIESVGYGAFAQSAIRSADLSSAEHIGDYAFTSCDDMSSVTLSTEGCDIGEGSFSYCSVLTEVNNMNAVKNFGQYAFAYAAVTDIDLENAVTVGDYAFLKETQVHVDLTLGDKLESLGDNPFAYCILDPIYKVASIEYMGNTVGTEILYTFDINDSIKIINGSIYTVVPYGLELTTYIGLDKDGNSLDRTNMLIPDTTVRISGMAFAGSDIVRVELPYTLKSIGHKAFYNCNDLTTVVFTSYTAPRLEEELDTNYYDSFQNLPSTGKYEFTQNVDTDGDGIIDSTENVTYEGLGIVPYYMWNITDYMYNSIYYGANFVDYIGHTDRNVAMVAPSNGQEYDSFILNQYFGASYAGDVVADQATLDAIAAIDRLPDRITLQDEALVIAAREAYNKVTKLQLQALITNYDKLRKAETRIEALKYTADDTDTDTDTPPADDTQADNETPSTDGGKDGLGAGIIVLIIIGGLAVLAGGGFAIWKFVIKKGKKDDDDEQET